VGNPEENLNHMAALLDQAGPADLAVFPELAVPGYDCRDLFATLAEPAEDSPSLRRVGDMAVRHHKHIAVGFAEADPNVPGLTYNALALLDPTGTVAAVYRKIHLWQEEQLYFARGARPALVSIQGVSVGLGICWDAAFPELARVYSLKGARLLLYVSAWDRPSIHEWDIHVTARALENAVFVAGCNRTGSDGDLAFGGHSQVVGPNGRIVKRAAVDDEEVFEVDIDPQEIVRRRAKDTPYFRDLAPWAYKLP
jgi:predicted amidohydrolase